MRRLRSGTRRRTSSTLSMPMEARRSSARRPRRRMEDTIHADSWNGGLAWHTTCSIRSNGERHAHHTQGGGDAHDQDHPAYAAEKHLVFTIDSARRGWQPVSATSPVQDPRRRPGNCVLVPGGIHKPATQRRRKGETAAGVLLHTRYGSVSARNVLDPARPGGGSGTRQTAARRASANAGGGLFSNEIGNRTERRLGFSYPLTDFTNQPPGSLIIL
jgi:hypothetical protein